MSRPHAEHRVDRLIPLAAGMIPEREAATLRRQIADCAQCRQAYARAVAIQDAVQTEASPETDDVTRARLWRNLAPAAQDAAARARVRSARRLVLSSPWVRAGIAATALVVFGALAVAVYLGSRDAPAAGPAPGATTAMSSGDDGARGSTLGQTLAASPSPARTRAADGALAATADANPAVFVAGPGERKLACGAVVRLAGAQAEIERDEARRAVIRLTSGAVKLRVPKLPRGARLEVHTADARVRVVGTRFSVRKLRGGKTTVSVSEGIVRVAPRGRNRREHLLWAGESRTVLGEVAYLRRIRARLEAAASAGRLSDAARLGKRYLAVTTNPAKAAALRLRLARLLDRQGKGADAAQLYRGVAKGGGSSAARQNALAALARLHARRGQHAKALAVWRKLADDFPQGLHEREALLELVRAGCHSRTRRAARDLSRLEVGYPNDDAARRLVLRCGLPE